MDYLQGCLTFGRKFRLKSAMHNGKRITNLPERGAYHLFPVLFPFNMADANTLIALMELSDDLEIEMSFSKTKKKSQCFPVRLYI